VWEQVIAKQLYQHIQVKSKPLSTYHALNVLLQRLANIQLQEGHDEFRWNLHKNGKILVASMYNALILPDVPIDKVSNDKL
jgi:AMMECR1 domain-containing protein